MPAWSTEEILAVHVRMHKAEGELFRDVLVAGAAALGRTVGPPWTRDQKEATAAAIVALRRAGKA